MRSVDEEINQAKYRKCEVVMGVGSVQIKGTVKSEDENQPGTASEMKGSARNGRKSAHKTAGERR